MKAKILIRKTDYVMISDSLSFSSHKQNYEYTIYSRSLANKTPDILVRTLFTLKFHGQIILIVPLLTQRPYFW